MIWSAKQLSLDRYEQSQRCLVTAGRRKSRCFLMTSDPNAMHRLGVLVRSNNGFEIAEADLEGR